MASADSRITLGAGTVTLTGRLADEPIVRHTETGRAVAGFRLAVRNSDGTETSYEVVSAKRNIEVVATYMKKDRLVEVQGYPYTYTWTDPEGTEHERAAIEAKHVQFVSPRRAAELRESERTARAIHQAGAPANAVHDRHRKSRGHGISR